MIRLWSINRWLRWTGFRLVIAVDPEFATNPDFEPTRIGLCWYGWSDLRPQLPRPSTIESRR